MNYKKEISVENNRGSSPYLIDCNFFSTKSKLLHVRRMYWCIQMTATNACKYHLTPQTQTCNERPPRDTVVNVRLELQGRGNEQTPRWLGCKTTVGVWDGLSNTNKPRARTQVRTGSREICEIRAVRIERWSPAIGLCVRFLHFTRRHVDKNGLDLKM